MEQHELGRRFAALTTAHLADACIRAGQAVRCGPAQLRPAVSGSRLAGPVRPARHAGSVDVFLEALHGAEPGDVLVVDNGGQFDEACVGDLVVLEAQQAGLAGLVVWGLHRDSADIHAIGLPVFSLGTIPTGPLSVHDRAEDALDSARVGEWTVEPTDVVFADDDGVLFVPSAHVDGIVEMAEAIRDTERRQAEQIRAGLTLREQVRFDTFLARRGQEPALTFRDHLRSVGGEIEV